MEAVDRFDDDPPLRQSGDRAQRVEASFHFDRHPNAQLRVVLDFLAFTSAGWRAACATPLFHTIVGHDRERWRRTAEIRRLRCVSDACDVGVDASDNVITGNCARTGPIGGAVSSADDRKDRNSLTNVEFAARHVRDGAGKRRGPRRSAGTLDCDRADVMFRFVALALHLSAACLTRQHPRLNVARAPSPIAASNRAAGGVLPIRT
jgi:hypothetical protein